MASVAGVGALIVAFPLLGNVIKFVGAAYLTYLGIDSLRLKAQLGANEAASGSVSGQQYNARKLFAR